MIKGNYLKPFAIIPNGEIADPSSLRSRQGKNVITAAHQYFTTSWNHKTREEMESLGKKETNMSLFADRKYKKTPQKKLI